MSEEENRTHEHESLRERLPEVLALVEEVKGRTGAQADTRTTVDNVGAGPAIEYVTVTIDSGNGNGEKKQTGYFVKRFLEEHEQKHYPFLQTNMRSLRQTEFDLLESYAKAGCNVPTPYVKKGNLLIIQKINGVALETKLLENSEDEAKRIALIDKVGIELDKINERGEDMQEWMLIDSNKKIRDRIIETAKLLKQADKYFTTIAAREDELRALDGKGDAEAKELISTIKNRCDIRFGRFNDFFGVLGRHFRTKKPQLIHGDMTTYHAIIDENEKPWVIDFGKPKFSSAVFDHIPIYFSQDSNLPIKAIEELFIKHLERRSISKDQHDEEIKSLYLGACFSNIGRGSKNRILRTVFPEEAELFESSHPSYRGSIGFYKESIGQILEYLLTDNNKRRFKLEEDYTAIHHFAKMVPEFMPERESSEMPSRENLSRRGYSSEERAPTKSLRPMNLPDSRLPRVS